MFASKVSVFVFIFFYSFSLLCIIYINVRYSKQQFKVISKTIMCRQIVCHYIMHVTINHKLLSLLACNTLIVCFHVVRILVYYSIIPTKTDHIKPQNREILKHLIVAFLGQLLSTKIFN